MKYLLLIVSLALPSLSFSNEPTPNKTPKLRCNSIFSISPEVSQKALTISLLLTSAKLGSLVSPDGQTLSIAYELDSPNVLKRWNPARPQQLASDSDQWFVTLADTSGKVKLVIDAVDLINEKIEKFGFIHQGRARGVKAIKFSKDGSLIMVSFGGKASESEANRFGFAVFSTSTGQLERIYFLPHDAKTTVVADDLASVWGLFNGKFQHTTLTDSHLPKLKDDQPSSTYPPYLIGNSRNHGLILTANKVTRFISFFRPTDLNSPAQTNRSTFPFPLDLSTLDQRLADIKGYLSIELLDSNSEYLLLKLADNIKSRPKLLSFRLKLDDETQQAIAANVKLVEKVPAYWKKAFVTNHGDVVMISTNPSNYRLTMQVNNEPELITLKVLHEVLEVTSDPDSNIRILGLTRLNKFGTAVNKIKKQFPNYQTTLQENEDIRELTQTIQ